MAIRADIQFLRGIAVLLVVFYHAGFSFFEGGYMGVDVFFVISGFLITGLIKKGIEVKTFTFAGFYYRRAKRLLPAAYTTFLVTCVMAYFLLTTQELSDFYDSMVGAITFTANMVLWGQGTYFGVESDLKPLLHTWSLSVEEQYYLLVPAIMVFTPRRFWSTTLLVAFLGSIVACLVLYNIQNAAAFYLFPARAWELLIGSAGALYYDRVNRDGYIKYFFWPGLIGILYLSINPFGGMHPGPDALLICLLTLLIILINNQSAFDNFLAKTIIWVGDISYSLYLIHWPLFAFAANIWISDIDMPLLYSAAIVGISIFLAYLQYNYVENRFRHKKSNEETVRYYPLITLSVFLVTIPIILNIILSHGNDSISNNRMGNTGLGQQCTFYDKFEDLADCRTGNEPSILVWGDSNAMHLVPGLAAVKGDKDIMQATKYVCGPMLGISPLGTAVATYQNKKWADTVILSSFFGQYFEYPTFRIYDGVKILSKLSKQEQLDLAVDAFSKTIDSLRAIGKKVVIIAPPPAMKFDAGRCEERKQNQMLRLGQYANCIMPYDDILDLRKDVYAFMDKVQRKSSVEIIKFDEYLIVDNFVITNSDQINIFIANAHLSYKGSVLLATEMDLVQRAIDSAY
jgi:peptidoglycan/LPS O-acetylase OafA/YrhL